MRVKESMMAGILRPDPQSDADAGRTVARSAMGVLAHPAPMPSPKRRTVSGMRLPGSSIVLLVAAVMTAATLSRGAAAQDLVDAERGRALYENHCQVCHTPRVHSRANRLPVSRAELREIVDNWQRQEALGWSTQDVADVVEYLNRTRYGYAR